MSKEKFTPVAERLAKAKLNTKYGQAEIFVYHGNDGKDHVALVFGELTPDVFLPVRVHSECLTGDTLFSEQCDCGEQLKVALETIQNRGIGLILYMRQEGRGIGLANKIRAYALQQQQGLDTYQANSALGLEEDARSFDIAASMLQDLGVEKVDLMTNNPEKIRGLEAQGLAVRRLPIKVKVSESAQHYKEIKAEVKQHFRDTDT